MTQPPRVCLACGAYTTHGSHCAPCQTRLSTARTARRHRPHINNDYRKAAKIVRDNAIVCHLCGEGSRINDPWTADHLRPADPTSPLLAAHRSCNSRRGNKPL